MKLWKILGIELYEVGDIFINMSGNNPGNRFKGTWSLIAQGRTLVGVDTTDSDFNTVRKSGGSKTHKLTVNEMPSHTHYQYVTASGTGADANRDYQSYGPSRTVYQTLTSSVGGGQPHNNLQPYLTTYIWERVS